MLNISEKIFDLYLKQTRFFIQFHDLKNIFHFSVNIDDASVQ